MTLCTLIGTGVFAKSSRDKTEYEQNFTFTWNMKLGCKISWDFFVESSVAMNHETIPAPAARGGETHTRLAVKNSRYPLHEKTARVVVLGHSLGLGRKVVTVRVGVWQV